MKIKTKILGALLAMSLLLLLVGALAINRQKQTALAAATTEAQNVAHALGLALISDSNHLDASAQAVVTRLHETEKRDVVLTDTHKMVLADVEPVSVGKFYVEDQHDEVAATIRDGIPRTFVEITPATPEGMMEITEPVISQSGETLGAIILEYTPLYNELMQATTKTIRQLILAVFLSLIASFIIAFSMGRMIAKPLEQLTRAAEGFASGGSAIPLQLSGNDEIGQLAKAFQNMMEKRQRAEQELRRLRDELEVRVDERTADLAKANETLITENTERKRAEETVRESEGKFRQLAENITDMFYVISPDFEKVHYISPAYEQIWGRSLMSLHARPQEWNEAIVSEDRVATLKAFRRLADDEPNISVEFRIVRPNGDVRWILSRGFQVRDDSGKVVRLTGIASDITERKLSESTLEKVNKELIASSRMAGMAEVATSVLHNVGNVLNSVNISVTVISDHIQQSKSGNLGKVAALMQERADDLGAFLTHDPKGKQLPKYIGQLAEYLVKEKVAINSELDSMRKNVDHIKDIVAMQQTYARVAGVTELVKVTDLVEDALRMNASALIRHDVRFFREYDANLPEIAMEKHKALQILVNLIRNAQQSCDAAGIEDKRLTMRVTNGAGRVRIALIDNGVGIPDENMRRMFTHGFTTKKNGHGFGLHSSCLAAKELGGTLTVQSEGPGKGATFTLELPWRPPEAKNYQTSDHDESIEMLTQK